MSPHRWLRLFTAAALTVSALSVPGTAAAAVAVEVTADYATTVGELDKSLLLNVSQGGYAALRNLHLLPGQAAELAALGVRQIRVDHVFDDAFYDVVQRTGYDFTRLDAVLRPFVDAGIRPWISLSYMPSEVAPTVFSPPFGNDYTRWREAVTAMVEHFGTEFGLSGLNWEVWNEPDHEDPDGGWWTGTPAQYLDLYRHSAEAVRLGDPAAQVGGPALAYASDPLLGSWLDFIAANPRVPCDFVSWHQYGAGAEFDTTTQVRDALTARGITGKKLYVTEWNSTFEMANGPGRWPDTHQTASYAADRMNAALGNPDGLSGIFFFTGLEAWHPARDFNGDLGLITVDGRRKAVGNVYAMVQSIGTSRLNATWSARNAGLITKNPSTRQVSVLLWNNTLDAASHRVTVRNLPYANFAVTRYDITATENNSWADHAAGIANQRPGPNERLRPGSRTVLPAADTWTATVSLPPNGTTLIQLAPTGEPTGPKPLAPVPTEVNLARAGLVSVSSTYTSEAGGWSPQRAVDGRRHSLPAANSGDPTMGWTSQAHPTPNVGTAGESVQVDLGSAQRFTGVTLWPRDDRAGDGRSFPADFTIAGSADGTAWTRLAGGTGYGGGAPVTGPQTFPVSTGPYRYVRVTATRLGLPVSENGTDVYRFQLAELEVTKPASNVALPNPGFESGTLHGWAATGNGTVTGTGGRSGAPAATFAGSGNGLHTTVTGLEPGASYTFSGYLRSAVEGDVAHLGVKNHGGTETSSPVGSTSYRPTSVTFTTGAAHTSAELYVYKNSGLARAWFDDFTLVRNR
ncbi:hypothetical protein DMB66_21080 [Actinoplanes sp. ATCC 53533]|uniref:GH39 family glycosyl hydrolase n=1 Tax=Actinoplanes sp. ATCC 53533 TaxID=1288362 RepID=UPI000F7B51C6|nr:discoidin domain-containing protein [Actinoplanes sp. ATCC 53533]RSM64131.1 hypothetical protein DMB66_21080 [Actinoplanes sp. ATCC 53533]